MAITSSIFLLLASITGVILAFEPIFENADSKSVANASSLTIAEAMENISSQYMEVLSIEKDRNDFIKASVITNEGANETFYVNPFNGEKLAEIEPEPRIFEFTTGLHRSLFLGTTGRLFIGITSFFFFLMSVSGVFLILRRQGGIKYFFTRVVKMSFWADYHTVLGRLTLIPIIIISLTGTYLSLLRFSVIQNPTINLSVDYGAIEEGAGVSISEIPAFKNNTLANLRSLEYPFSPDVEDPFYLKLEKKELMVNQLTGEILAEAEYPFVALFSELALVLHTGQGTIVWAAVLGLASLAVPFFIYSGFSITLRRKKKKFKNPFAKEKCEYIILVGSEGGSTWQFANLLHTELLRQKKHSYMTDLNKFEHFKNMEHLLIVTATYGQGEAPSNAAKFVKRFNELCPQQHTFSYSVVGFGSLAYPEFCKFAFDLDQLVASHPNGRSLLGVHTINNQSFEAFSQWVNALSAKLSLTLELPKAPNLQLKKKLSQFEVVDRAVSANREDDTVLLQLAPKNKGKYQAGDLLAIYPENSDRERLYSMGTDLNGKNILLSVKRHNSGVCSNFLHNLQPGDVLEGSLLNNNSFHFPRKAPKVVMIGNGTGIAPFLGMIGENGIQRESTLYWGSRDFDSLNIYKSLIEQAIARGTLTRFVPAYSRCDQKLYVQNLIQQDAEFIARTFKSGGVFMICGSITMQKGVTEVLDQICREKNGNPLSYYQNNKQVLMDCY